MTEYIQIEEPKEIRHLNSLLSVRLKRELPHVETRTIGYPRGTFEASVRFRTKAGSDVLYWSGKLSNRNRKARNFFGHGTPGAHNALGIDVQFNVPVVKFSRAYGGVFLRDIGNRIVLAHTGIVTLGHGRIPKDLLFAEMFATIREAATSAGNSEFLLIGELDSPSLIGDLDTFSAELRRAAKRIKTKIAKSPRRYIGHTKRHSQTLSTKLRDYFDESSGVRRVKGRSASIADCYHGTVVRAIRDSFRTSVIALKSQAIDLTVIADKTIRLFEVKTSSTPQHVYTAIGQLMAHAPSVARLAPDKKVIHFIVLPEPPNRRLHDILVKELGIRLLTFTRSADNQIVLHGLWNN
jgi:hypothetical protein